MVPFSWKFLNDDGENTGLLAELLFINNFMYEDEEQIDLNMLDEFDSNQNVLVEASLNYADEFNMTDHQVFTINSLKEFILDIRKIAEKGEIEWYFGSNECFSYSGAEELMNCFKVIIITDTEAKILDKVSTDDSGVFSIEIDYDFDNDEDEAAYYLEEEEKDLAELNIKLTNLRKHGWTMTDPSIGEDGIAVDFLDELSIKHDKLGSSIGNSRSIDLLDRYYNELRTN